MGENICKPHQHMIWGSYPKYMKKLHNSKIEKSRLKMSKGFEYTFIQRRYTNGPKVHAKINITNQGDANQNYEELSHAC